jgi:hypothetical protein
MDEFEELLRRYRPVGPPLELRDRVVAAGSAPAWTLGEWVPSAAAVIVAVLFYWLAAREQQILMARLPSAPPSQSAVVGVEEPGR